MHGRRRWLSARAKLCITQSHAGHQHQNAPPPPSIGKARSLEKFQAENFIFRSGIVHFASVVHLPAVPNSAPQAAQIHTLSYKVDVPIFWGGKNIWSCPLKLFWCSRSSTVSSALQFQGPETKIKCGIQFLKYFAANIVTIVIWCYCLCNNH